MFSAIYIEKNIRHHERVLRILSRHPDIPVIDCARYGEIFNRNGQNFRLQKQAPALILAEKFGHKVLPTPEGYGFEDLRQGKDATNEAVARQSVDSESVDSESADSAQGFYFSHMMNCVYDCRYCFLQGMYRSANYVLFVNYEDFAEEIIGTAGNAAGKTIFYSGYDCDSLALEPISEFCNFVLPLFRNLENAVLELRTKSTQVRRLLTLEPMYNCVVAMSFAPAEIAENWEHKVPELNKRIDALARLQAVGWPVAVRFEPVIPTTNTAADYEALFTQVFESIDSHKLHSCSLGEYRLPRDFYKRMVKLHPDSSLLARDVVESNGMIGLQEAGDQLLQELEVLLSRFVDANKYYRCA